MAVGDFGATKGWFLSLEIPCRLRFRRSKGDWTAYSQGIGYWACAGTWRKAYGGMRGVRTVLKAGA
ncbi:hypothetical protein V6Z11_A07G060700 [Gossypium hirsutum]